MGYRVKPFTMSVRNNSTQEFVDVGLLGSDVDADISDIKEKVDGFVTPESFGAAGDGVTDDTTAVQDAIASGKLVYAGGNYYLASQITLGYNAKIHFAGNINAPNGFLINSTDADLYIYKLTGNGTGNGVTFTDPPSTDNLGACCRNRVTVKYIDGFISGLYFYSAITQKGIQYNKVSFDRIINCTYGIKMESRNTRSWVNNNQIEGGSIYGGNANLISVGVYGIADSNSEISSNVFRDIAFEGIENEAVNMTNCAGNHFADVRIAEEVHGTNWIYLNKCIANIFDGYINFNIKQITDIKDPNWSNSYSYFAANRFDCYNVILGANNNWRGTGRVWTYNNERVLEGNLGNSDVVTVNTDYNMADVTNGFCWSNGSQIVMSGNHTLTLTSLFVSHMTEFILFIRDSNSVTIRDADGTTLKTVTGYGKHYLKWFDGGLIEIPIS